MKIEIEKVTDEFGSSIWKVRCGDRYCNELMAGEALEAVARLILVGEDSPNYLQTQAAHDAQRAAWDAMPKAPHSPTSPESRRPVFEQDEANFPNVKIGEVPGAPLAINGLKP